MNVRELMTENPVVGRPTMPLDEAQALLESLDVRHLPIIDEAGELVGMLSERDLRRGAPGPGLPSARARAAEARATLASAGPTVSERMSGAPLTVDPEDDLLDVLDLLVETRIGALPVVEADSRQLVGIVSYLDVLRGVRELFAGT